jgi:hypothetical protein
MDRHTELCKKYAYLKARKRLDLLKSRTGICYHNLMNKTENITDNALNHIRDVYNVALDLERAELIKVKRDIDDRLSEIAELI